MSEQVTKAYKIFNAIAIISGSLVFNAAKLCYKYLNFTLDGDNQLRDDWKNFSATFLKHIENTLHSQESVWVLLFSDSLEEDGEIMMII